MGCLAIIVPTGAQAEPKKAGDTVPDVQLRKADGSSLGLHEAVARQPGVFVFYRGGWCPYCSTHLAELGRIESNLLELGFAIYAVSPDRPEKLIQSIEKNRRAFPEGNPGYTLLSDSQMEAARAFGIAFTMEETVVLRYREQHNIDLEDSSGETHHSLPHPAVFVVGKGGEILFAHVDTDYRVRLSGSDILAAAKRTQ